MIWAFKDKGVFHTSKRREITHFLPVVIGISTYLTFSWINFISKENSKGIGISTSVLQMNVLRLGEVKFT